MKKCALITAFLLLTVFSVHSRGEEFLPDSMKSHPEWYIKIPDWSVYATWSAVAIIHLVTIENTSDIPYKNIVVRVTYTSNTAGGAGTVISQEVGVLPVTVPPKSKDTYLKAGVPIGAGSQFMNPHSIQVLGATPVLD